MKTPDYIPILCGDYEMFEAVCMYRYDVELQLNNQTVLTGKAVDLKIFDGAEYLILENQESDDARVRVDRIHSLRTLTHPSLFSEYVFTSPKLVQNLKNQETNT